MLRRKLGYLIPLPRHACERRGLHRKWLRGRIPFARYVSLRDRALLDAVDGFAVAAVEDENQPRFSRLDQSRDFLTVMDHVNERRLWRQIVIPQIMVHGLEIPLQLAGRRVRRNQRI